MENYNKGDIIEYSNNGINKWIVVYNRGDLLRLIPEKPIELVIESINDNLKTKANEVIQSFNNDVSLVLNYDQTTGPNDGNLVISEFLSDFFSEQTEKIYFYRSNIYYYVENKSIKFNYGQIDYYENGNFSWESSNTLYTDISAKTLGYRPIVTLKIKEQIQDKDKKEISSKLQVGDYVKYEAKGYKNWKVLSIDENLGTVDIISGGIVKNITISGKEDWDNYEDIIQREVDEYKNGNQAKRTTTVTSKDLKILKEIDKSILSRYWLLSKTTDNIGKISIGNEYAEKIIYSIGTINISKNENFEMYLNNITVYADLKGNQNIVNHYKNRPAEVFIKDSNINDINLSSYTAGLRPVITLKLDSVEKLSKEEAKRIEESTEKQEKVFIKEQESKNKDYKGPSKVDDSTSSTGNNNEVKSNDNDNTKENITDNNTSNVEKIVYKDKPFYKYGFIIATILCIIEPVITILIYKKIKER